MGDKIFGLVLLGIGLFVLYSGFNDDFSIGDIIVE
jgi:hypothetical protein